MTLIVKLILPPHNVSLDSAKVFIFVLKMPSMHAWCDLKCGYYIFIPGLTGASKTDDDDFIQTSTSPTFISQTSVHTCIHTLFAAVLIIMKFLGLTMCICVSSTFF